MVLGKFVLKLVINYDRIVKKNILIFYFFLKSMGIRIFEIVKEVN